MMRKKGILTRLGGVLGPSWRAGVGTPQGRALKKRGFWDPLIDNFQENQTPDNKAKPNNSTRPARRSAVADIWEY